MLTSATTQLATPAGSQLAAAGSAVAKPQLEPREAQPVVEPAPAQAGFNPFGTIGTAVQQPAPLAHVAEGGDLSLPLVATLVGIILIASLLRKMVQ